MAAAILKERNVSFAPKITVLYTYAKEDYPGRVPDPPAPITFKDATELLQLRSTYRKVTEMLEAERAGLEEGKQPQQQLLHERKCEGEKEGQEAKNLPLQWGDSMTASADLTVKETGSRSSSPRSTAGCDTFSGIPLFLWPGTGYAPLQGPGGSSGAATYRTTCKPVAFAERTRKPRSGSTCSAHGPHLLPPATSFSHQSFALSQSPLFLLSPTLASQFSQSPRQGSAVVVRAVKDFHSPPISPAGERPASENSYEYPDTGQQHYVVQPHGWPSGSHGGNLSWNTYHPLASSFPAWNSERIAFETVPAQESPHLD